jgi:hypothetical protein
MLPRRSVYPKATRPEEGTIADSTKEDKPTPISPRENMMTETSGMAGFKVRHIGVSFQDESASKVDQRVSNPWVMALDPWAEPTGHACTLRLELDNPSAMR